MTSVRIALFVLAFGAAACSHDSTTSPSSTTTSSTTAVTTPTTSEAFAGIVPVGGGVFYSFNIAANGTVNVTLNGVSGAGVPASVQLGIGIGTPAGVDCSVSNSVTAASGTTPQLTGTFGPGVFCVRIYDVGNLAAPASFSATIAHS